MARTTLEATGRLYTVNLDDPARSGDRYQSLVITQVIDELTGRPVTEPVRVTTGLDGARPKTARDGICGVAGIPSRHFPDLDSQPYRFDISVEVAGFVPSRRLTIDVPQQPGFPDDFAGVELIPLALRRQPVTIVVRTMQIDGGNRLVALSGATVEIGAVYRTVGDLAGAPTLPDLVSLRPPLYARRPQPGTTLEPVTMTPVVEPERRLARAAPPGSLDIAVDRTGGLVAGSIVAIDMGDVDRAEYIEVDDIVGPADLSSPSTVVLSFPVHNRHREGATVQEVTAGALGPPAADLTDEGLPGDATAFVDTVAPFATAPVARVSGGTSSDEFVRAIPYRVVTDPEGYGHMPPMTRVAAIEIQATAPGPLASPPTRFTPRYGDPTNQSHLVLE